MVLRKFNERSWSGQLISWIGELINNNKTIFQSATNDEGIKVDNRKTKFPDVLLFLNKYSGIVFNGWELKFPDTPVDDIEMLENALEKAKHLQSSSFVTFNGRDAIIWKINDTLYSIQSLSKIKVYSPIKEIRKREDMAEISNYNKFEQKLKERCFEIIKDLENLYKNNELKPAINISNDFTENIVQASEIIIPELSNIIKNLKGTNPLFRKDFNKWLILEKSTIQILNKTSREVNIYEPELILSKFIYYKILGKILFYLNLSENINEVPPLFIEKSSELQIKLESYFSIIKDIDYQAIFNEDFTDEIIFSNIVNETLFILINFFNNYNFNALPRELIGNILENLVPEKEKIKFGQYFTSPILADFITMSAIQTKNDLILDGTSGTGTFLSSSYHILKYLGLENHQDILSQIWGNDISHFPATLSVINLYKEKVEDIKNFPRIIRDDYLNLFPEKKLKFPNPSKIGEFIDISIPKFDVIVGNFPFIQQEDISKDELQEKFRTEFGSSQKAFMTNNTFRINERSDYYIYCFYNSLKFLNEGSRIAIITSNAWLGKNYGTQFKKFILDNFTIEYIVKSEEENWFKNSDVNTIYITLIKGKKNINTKFITLGFKLNEFVKDLSNDEKYQKIEDFYTEIDLCEEDNNIWLKDSLFNSVYLNKKNKLRVSIVNNKDLINSLDKNENWDMFFISSNPFKKFENKLIKPFPEKISVGRGIRTGQDKMFILKKEQVQKLKIETENLKPILKSSRYLKKIKFDDEYDNFIFICDKPLSILEQKYPNSFKWIKKWENARNITGKSLKEVLENQNAPHWYSLNQNDIGDIFCSINPDKKLFFSYSINPIYLNQRLIKVKVNNPDDKEIIVALLNSVLSLLNVEFNGISRNLGALDLNADFFKSKLMILDYTLLSQQDKNNIIEKFNKLKNREIKSYDEEFNMKDRIEFDTIILKVFGFDISDIPKLYNLLKIKIKNRIEMKTK